MNRCVLIGIIVVFLLPISGLAAETCDFCSGDIDGEYFVFRKAGSNFVVCEQCSESLGRCSLCGIPVAGTRNSDQDVVCRTCRLEAEKCDACGNILLGTFYLDDLDHRFCKPCFDSAERCWICKNILLPGYWRSENGKRICTKCLNDQPRCSGCGSIINGQYSMYKGFEGVYCTSCVNNSPVCLACLRPCGPHSVTLKNGNEICRDCARTAIVDATGLESIVLEVSRYMERHLLMSIDHAIDFKLVDSLKDSRHPVQYRESGRFIRYNDDFTIKILLGLSKELCIETVAHELAHAWQAENSPHLSNDELVEGFAQWVSTRVLTGLGYPLLVDRFSDRDDVYGRGFRRLKEMEKRYGFSGVFREIERLGRSR